VLVVGTALVQLEHPLHGYGCIVECQCLVLFWRRFLVFSHGPQFPVAHLVLAFLVKAVPVKRSVLPKIPLMKSQKVVMVLRPKDVYVAVHM
jgi:hypothetical protein